MKTRLDSNSLLDPVALGSVSDLVSRRHFLGSLAAGTALPAIQSVAFSDVPQPKTLPDRSVDVAVMGAGLSGLVAARELKKRGHRVCVLEARPRVGGRTLDIPLGAGQVVEGGGEWVGPGQTAILQLAREMGVATYISYERGKMVMAVGKLRYTTGQASPSPEVQKVQRQLDELANSVPRESPWKAARAGEWDSTTVAAWLGKNASRSTREEFEIELETELGKAAHISLLYYLFYIRSAGGVRALNTDAQKMRLRGGPQSISQKLASDLGNVVVLSSPVQRIHSDPNDGALIDSARVRVRARRVIIAMMPADMRRIEFTPALPAQRRGLIRSWRAETAFKVNVVYAKPFWRSADLSGLGISDLGVTFDNSPPSGSPGVLVIFADKDQLPADKRKRRDTLLDGLARLFGQQARKPIKVLETDWAADGWSAGCVSPLPPGVLTRFGPALREPVGCIHWAGTETSSVWCGYMDGAVRAGRRAAREVHRALR